MDFILRFEIFKNDMNFVKKIIDIKIFLIFFSYIIMQKY